MIRSISSNKKDASLSVFESLLVCKVNLFSAFFLNITLLINFKYFQ